MSTRRFQALSNRPITLAVGQEVEGTLQGIAPEGDYNTQVLYLVDDDGRETRLWSCTWLDNLINESHVGLYLKIKRLPDLPAKKHGQNPAKAFEVLVDSDELARVPASEPSEAPF